LNAIFDLATARGVVARDSPYLTLHHGDDLPWLDLGEFETYELAALEYLADEGVQLEGIDAGFREITGSAAKAMSRLRVSFFFLHGLDTLDERAAVVLGHWDRDTRPIRDFVLRQPLSEFSAYALTADSMAPDRDGFCDRPLSVCVPSLDVGAANGLARHGHELFVTVKDEPLLPDAAAALARQVGYALTLNLDQPLLPATSEALASNPRKEVRVTPRGDHATVYVVDPGWLPGIAGAPWPG